MEIAPPLHFLMTKSSYSCKVGELKSSEYYLIGTPIQGQLWRRHHSLLYSQITVYFLPTQWAACGSAGLTHFDWYLLTQNALLTDRWTGRQHFLLRWLHSLSILCSKALTPWHPFHTLCQPLRLQARKVLTLWCWEITWQSSEPFAFPTVEYKNKK